MIDYASGRKSQENFLPAFGEAANCRAEKLHMGWLVGPVRGDGWMGRGEGVIDCMEGFSLGFSPYFGTGSGTPKWGYPIKEFSATRVSDFLNPSLTNLVGASCGWIERGG